MNKLERAVENLIKAAGKVHPAIQAMKQCHPKPPRKPRAKREKVDATIETSVAEAPAAAAVIAVNKKIKFTKGSQEAKDFMNMLRQRRASKK